MIATDKIATGLSRYLDAELLPQMPAIKAVALGTAAALYLRRLPDLINQLPPSLGITDGNMVDLDAVKTELIKHMNAPIPVDIPLVGRITFDQAEVDKIYRYIVDA